MLTEQLTRSLACAAISPALRSILVFDTTPEKLHIVAQTLVEMLRVTTGYNVKTVTLGTYEAEDDLWNSIRLSSNSGSLVVSMLKWLFSYAIKILESLPETSVCNSSDLELFFFAYQVLKNCESKEVSPIWKPGLLVGGETWCIVVIPDLTKLSLAATRACVVLMDTDVAHLERHGQQAQWKPNLCWLAGCANDEVGMVSPHLLDRFALRLQEQVKKTETIEARVAELRELINERNASQQEAGISAEVEKQLQTAVQIYPTITDQAIARVLEYISPEVQSHRREIALARLSFAYARLEGAAEMTAKHVDAAAQMIGLKRATPEEKNSPDTPSQPSPPPEPPKPELSPQEEKTIPRSSPSPPSIQQEPVYVSDAAELTSDISVTLDTGLRKPYPEDEAPVEREAASLRLPTRRFRSKTAARGSIIGVEKATNLQDLALVRTLLEAAKFQQIRQPQISNGQRRLVLSPTDLHRYRRSPVAEQMLMLVLDHTCLRDCNWQDELLPYLSWAYVERASVCLIQVGAANARHELRAEKVIAQSILVPRISAGIEAEPGKATPLAHGLDLALQTLRHALQHGRSTVQQAALVVISDGRGNIPLETSREGKITKSVGRKGFESALDVAKQIRSLDGVKAVLLNPQPKQYADLPLQLAEAMGASVFAIPPLETVEVE